MNNMMLPSRSSFLLECAFAAAVFAFVMVCASPGRADDAAKRLTIVVIGATAKTADALIPLALSRGHTVIGLARRPDAVSMSHERLTVVAGDVYDRASLAAAMSGDEVVVSLYGPRVDMTKEVAETDLFSTGYRNLIEAMKAKGNSRLLATSSIAKQRVIDVEPPEDAPRADKWLWQIRGYYNDMRKMEEIVRASGLDFTILQPAQLMVEPKRNDLKFTVDNNAPELTLITYEDFAAFILDEMEQGNYLGKAVAIYSDRKLQYGVNFMTAD